MRGGFCPRLQVFIYISFYIYHNYLILYVLLAKTAKIAPAKLVKSAKIAPGKLVKSAKIAPKGNYELSFYGKFDFAYSRFRDDLIVLYSRFRDDLIVLYSRFRDDSVVLYSQFRDDLVSLRNSS